MYPSDLTDEEWDLIEPFFQRPDPRGSQGKHAKRDIVNAMLYVVQGGIQWRMLPKEFPPWNTVYDHFRRFNQRGVWQQASTRSTSRVGVDRANYCIPPMPLLIPNRAKPNTPVTNAASMREKNQGP